MKKVRYLAGVLGLAPVAAGFLIPGTALGASGSTAHADGSAIKAKTVSLNHTAMHRAGCTGTIQASAYSNIYNSEQLFEKFWYTTGGCIGQVWTSNYVRGCGDVRVRIWDGPHASILTTSQQVYQCGGSPTNSFGWVAHRFAFHEYFGGQIMVCDKFLPHGIAACKVVN